VLGNILAEVNKPSAPLAQEFKVPYFPSDDVPVTAGAPEVNRYTFRLGHNTRVKAQVSHRWALDNFGDRWTFVSSDGSWGRGQVQDYSERINILGGQVLDTIFGPIGTADFIPLLASVDFDNTDVLYHTVFGSDAVTFYAQALELGVFERVRVCVRISTSPGPNP
jgi:ABC-type branched-subunit amino acid transport system substrate-binding protein